MDKRVLKSAEGRLRLFETQLAIGSWLWDLESGDLSWSPGLYDLIGLDRATVVPSLDLYQSLVHPDDQIHFDNAVGLASDARLQKRTFRVIRPDGGLRWLKSQAETVFSRTGKPIALAGVVADVTELQNLKLDLHVESQAVANLSRLLRGRAWRARPDGKLIETADWTRITGQTPEEARDWDRLAIHPDDLPRFIQAWQDALTHEREFQALLRIRRQNGIYEAVEARALPVRNLDGKIIHWNGVTYSQKGAKSGGDTGDLHPEHIRGARGMLNWSYADLANRSGVSVSTVRRLEQSVNAARPDKLAKVRAAFKTAGVTFHHEANGDVIIRKQAIANK